MKNALQSRIWARLKAEDGAITIDWLQIMVMCVGAMTVIMGALIVPSVERTSNNIAFHISSVRINTSFTPTYASAGASAGASGASSAAANGNPGNHAAFGRAGEDPNGSGNFGLGDRGQSR